MVLVLFSCTKTTYIIEEPHEQIKNSSPGTFEIVATNITDKKVDFQWGSSTDPDGEPLTYEVALNDSVIAYDLTANKYTIEKLVPGIEYKITVTALDKLRNSSKASKTVRTLKSFLLGTFFFDLAYEKYSFIKAIKTSDSGVLVLGMGSIFERTKPSKYFLLKLKSDYSIEWVKEFEWGALSSELPITIKEIQNDGFFVVQWQKITKVDYLGNSKVLYEVPVEYKVNYLRDIEIDLNGNYIVVGESHRNWPTPPICIEYFLVKLNQNGAELWHSYGGSTIVNYPTAIKRVAGNQYLIVGLAESTKSASYDENHDWRTNFWVKTIDENGNEISEQIFKNIYLVDDVLNDCLLESDGSLTLAGAAAGSFTGAYNTKARFTKISSQSNKIIWDIVPGLESNGIFCSIDCIDKIQSDGGYIVLASDNQGISISEFSILGNLNRTRKLRDYPSGVFVKYNPLGYYEYITKDGFLVVFNRDGYYEY